MFWDSFGTVAMQVLSLFIMMAMGFAMYKCKLFGTDGVTAMSNVLLWGVTPCVMFENFQRDFDPELARSMLIFVIVACIAIAAVLYTAPLLFRLIFKRCLSEKELLTFACAFSNCGFMGIPLAAAVFGAEGAMYASLFVAGFNLMQWTFGYMRLTGGGVSLRKVLINPGILGIVFGLPLFLFSIKLPTVVSGVISSVAALNTPLAMIVVGAHLAAAKLVEALKDTRVYIICLLRLIVYPVIGLLLLWVLPIPLADVPMVVLLIEFAAPCAATCVLIGSMCGKNTELAGRCVALSTLLSLLTMPVLVSAAKVLLMA